MTHTDDPLVAELAEIFEPFITVAHGEGEAFGSGRAARIEGRVDDREGRVVPRAYPTPGLVGLTLASRKQLADEAARQAIDAVRQHDEQAALNCGHCSPNTDEIACGCQIKERDDE